MVWCCPIFLLWVPLINFIFLTVAKATSTLVFCAHALLFKTHLNAFWRYYCEQITGFFHQLIDFIEVPQWCLSPCMSILILILRAFLKLTKESSKPALKHCLSVQGSEGKENNFLQLIPGPFKNTQRCFKYFELEYYVCK